MKLLTSLLSVGALAMPALAGPPSVTINEIDSDQTGTDAAEFVELLGPPNTSLAGYVVVFFNGSNDLSYASFDLDAVTTDANGFAVIGNTGIGAPDVVFAGNTLQNGADAVALYLGDGTSFPNNTPVTATGLVDAIVYGTDDPDDAGLLSVLGGTQINEDEFNQATTDSIGRLCTPGAFVVLDTPTPRASNGTCELDTDLDGIPDSSDNCPNDFNPGQEDCDNDGIGDACDTLKSDCNNNGIEDECESPDCNNNNRPDSCDIADLTSQDCNLNGIPDECEPDCNGSGFPDDCDILLLISQDCDGNNIPDECQEDCDGNGQADACDLLANPALDGDGNGILDVCENTIAIVVNEILVDPPGTLTTDLVGDANNDGTRDAEDDEFIEIYNDTPNPVNLTGWSISDAVGIRHIFPTGTVVQPSCSIVVFGAGNPTGQFGGGVVQTASTLTLGLSNGGDTVTLRDNLNRYVAIVPFAGSLAGDDTSIQLNREITGTTYVKHNSVSILAYSVGRRTDGTLFGGCVILPDADNDGVPDATDNCVNAPNGDQADCDNDNIGDVCETDPDTNGNTIPDNCEVGVPANVRLNEIRIDQDSFDCDEYIEIKGPAGTSLTGLSIIVIGDQANFDSGRVEAIIPLSGVIPADGHYLIAEAQFALAGGVDLVLAGGDASCNNGGLNFENSDNITVLLVTNSFTQANQDLDADGPNGDGTLDAPLPWSAIVDAVGLIEETFTPPTPPSFTEFAYGASLGFEDIGPDVTFVPGHIYRCESAGTWTIGPFSGEFTPMLDTPGTANEPCTGGNNCPPDITGDNVVGIADLLAVIGAWGVNPGNPADIAPQPTPDGVVGIADLLAVIGAWGVCPP